MARRRGGSASAPAGSNEEHVGPSSGAQTPRRHHPKAHQWAGNPQFQHPRRPGPAIAHLVRQVLDEIAAYRIAPSHPLLPTFALWICLPALLCILALLRLTSIVVHPEMSHAEHIIPAQHSEDTLPTGSPRRRPLEASLRPRPSSLESIPEEIDRTTARRVRFAASLEESRAVTPPDSPQESQAPVGATAYAAFGGARPRDPGVYRVSADPRVVLARRNAAPQVHPPSASVRPIVRPPPQRSPSPDEELPWWDQVPSSDRNQPRHRVRSHRHRRSRRPAD